MKTFLSIAGLSLLSAFAALPSQAAPAAAAGSNSLTILGGGGYGDWWVPHASTFAEGVGRGVGDVMRSTGQMNLLNSQAALNFSQYQRMQMDNAAQYVNEYFALRKQNDDLRAQVRGPRLTQEQLVRLAGSRLPARLSPGELDPFTGRIAWPILLSAPEYAADRAELEQLFAARATHGGQTTQEYLRTRTLVDDLLSDLKDQIWALPPPDFVTAKRFLNGLLAETRAPAHMVGAVGMMR